MMEKQIFIPKSFTGRIDELVLLIDETNEDILTDKIIKFSWLGMLNSFLTDKANAKEIVKVERYQKFEDGDIMFLGHNSLWENANEVYLVTYLESEMNEQDESKIATKEDLEKAFHAGEIYCKYFYRYELYVEQMKQQPNFDKWFKENF